MTSYDLERRRLSGDISHHRSTFDLKQREGRKTVSILLKFYCILSTALRRIGDTKSRLDTIYAKQRQLNASVAVTEQDRRATHLQSKLTVCTLPENEQKKSKLFI